MTIVAPVRQSRFNRGMKAASGAALCVVLLASAVAMADTFYRYHDSKTGRDVFVNRLDQVPQKYRGQAKIVLDGAAQTEADRVKQVALPLPPDDGVAEKLIKKWIPAEDTTQANLNHATTGRSVWKNGPAIAAAAVDAKLGRAGATPLVQEERDRLGRLATRALVVSAVAALCAFVVWVVLIVCAFRDKHPGWGVLMLFVSPLAYLYLLLHFAKGKPLLKTAASLGLLSPALVALWAAWQFYAWFHLVVQARGGRV